MTSEAHGYIVELESYFNNHNVPIFIYRRFIHLVNEASEENQNHIIYRVANVTIEQEDHSYFHYVLSEPITDKAIMAEVADLLDGYVFYVVEIGKRTWHFRRIKE